VVAASMKECGDDVSYTGAEADDAFIEGKDTVYRAARCLGLSRKDLFDADSVGSEKFPVRLKPGAFHAVFRIARAACVGLPTLTTADDDYITKSREMRRQSCGSVVFKPKSQPLDLSVQQAGAGDAADPVEADAVEADLADEERELAPVPAAPL